MCKGLGDSPPELALLFCSSDVDGAAVAATLRQASEAKGGVTTLVGHTSQSGVLSSRGVGPWGQGLARLGLVGMQHAAWLVAVAEEPIEDEGHAEAAGASAARAMLAHAAHQTAGRVTSPPDLLLLLCAPVGEEALLRGIQHVCGYVAARPSRARGLSAPMLVFFCHIARPLMVR